MSDTLHRFTFAKLPVRGEVIDLSKSFQQICDQHQYPDNVRQLLGEALAACALMTEIIKIEGSISLQLQSDSYLKLLLVECNHLGHLRGVLHTNPEFEADDLDVVKAYNFSEWTRGGQMAITIDPNKGKRYQGVVPLEQLSLAACLEDYFSQSEQLPTYIKLFSSQQQVRGLFLQALPDEDNQAAFEHVSALAETLKAEEAFELENEEMLYRLYHQDEVTLFAGKKLMFQCSCSRQRNIAALCTIDPAELVALVKEQNNEIEMVCDFCSSVEIFNEQQIMQVLANNVGEDTVN